MNLDLSRAPVLLITQDGSIPLTAPVPPTYDLWLESDEPKFEDNEWRGKDGFLPLMNVDCAEGQSLLEAMAATGRVKLPAPGRKVRVRIAFLPVKERSRAR